MMGADELLRHDADLLRQLDAAHRPRVHDDRSGHPRASPAPAGRGDLLPDRDGRARFEHPAGRRGGGPRPAGVRRPKRRRVPGDDRARERVERLLRPHDRRAAQGARAGVPPADLRPRGDIFESVYAGLYCTRCESFYTEDELVDGLCPQHGIRPEFVEEKNYFFRLSAYQEPLLRLYDERPDIVLPRFRYNEARSFIERGLDDISVSRASQHWGVPVPWDTDQVVYVWVDALINYWSALAFARPGEDLRPRFWPEVRHLLAKDILKFHCVIWPALLLAAGLEVPKQLFVHGYLLMDERKMSKSLGNVIDPLDLIDVYGVDPLRFYLFRVATFGQDGSISVEGLHERYERELGNDLGNLLSRTTAMIARYREGRLRPRGRVGGACGRGRPRPRRVRRPARSVRPHRSPGDDLGARARLNRHVEQAGPLGARQGRGSGGRARPRPLRARRRTAGGRGRARRVRPGDRRADPGRARSAGAARVGRRRRRARRRGRGDRARAAALPAGGRAHGGCVRPRPRTTGRRR